MTSYDARRVHLMAGFARSGRRARAVCTCGEATTPRASEARALTALRAEHGATRAQCALCGHDYEGLSWQRIRDGAAQRQVHLDRAAFDALGVAKPPAVLRVVKGGRDA